MAISPLMLLPSLDTKSWAELITLLVVVGLGLRAGFKTWREGRFSQDEKVKKAIEQATTQLRTALDNANAACEAKDLYIAELKRETADLEGKLEEAGKKSFEQKGQIADLERRFDQFERRSLESPRG